MNEQIKQLAEQAGLKIESLMTNPPKPFQILGSTEDFEKFAELIVQECITIMDATAKDAEDTCRYMGDDVPTFAHQYAIKKHFGVE